MIWKYYFIFDLNILSKAHIIYTFLSNIKFKGKNNKLNCNSEIIDKKI